MEKASNVLEGKRLQESSVGTGVGGKYARSKLCSTVWAEKGIVSSIGSWDVVYEKITCRIPVKVNDVPVSVVVDASAKKNSKNWWCKNL